MSPVRTMVGAAVTALTLFAAAPAPGQAAPKSAPEPAPAAEQRFMMAPGMVDALRRDLGLTGDELAARLATEAAAPVVQRRLTAALGAAYGGAWIPKGGNRLTVAVTDPAQATRVRAEGAVPAVVTHSAADLTASRERLDRAAARADEDQIHSWYVDPARNSVVIAAAPGAEQQARAFARTAGATGIEVVTSTEAPRPFYDIRGGDQYVINGNTLCSVGFSVAGGFVSAGHCGGVNSPTLGNNNVAQGTFAGSSFPGNDYAWIRTNANWTPQPWVNNYAGGTVTVAGSQDAAIGSSICRSGRTTGWRCGTLQAYNATVNYAQGAVTGMGRTSACAEPGDSGGSFIAGNQAQGVTSGGSGNCSSGGTTYFQPVNEILGVYGLSLTTTGGGSGGSALISNWNNKCIDVPNSNFSDGVPVQMWNCNNTGAQRWAAVNGTLQTANNKCLDVAWGSTASGAVIQIVGCSGNAAQQWVLSAAGDLVNPQANKCIDIAEWNGNDGARLQLWDCAGTLNQKWRRG